MKSNTYLAAVAAIETHVAAKQAELDAAAAKARTENLAAYRAAVMEGAYPEAEDYSIRLLLSQTLTIGRDTDGYPEVIIPQDTARLLLAAQDAGMISLTIGTLTCHPGFSGFRFNLPIVWEADYNAWRAATVYRDRQTINNCR